MRTDKELERIYTNFPDRLSSILARKGLSNRDITHKMAVSATTVINWLNGVSKPDMLSIFKLANALDMSTDELLGF